MFGIGRYVFALVIACSLFAAPEVAAFRRDDVAIRDLRRTAVFADAARSTQLLLMELSAVRLRHGSRNRTALV